MSWRVADSLDVLLAQINEIAPGRSKVSDGSIGDIDHQNRTSDHNPWIEDPPGPNVVSARDFTDDDSAGADMRAISEAIRLSEDPRVKYVIHEGRLFASYQRSHRAAWEWGPYSGPSGHFKHMHVSVQPIKALYDSTLPWRISMADHSHTPMPDELPRAWGDDSWRRWVARSGTKSDTRTHSFYREDLGWVYDRIIAPLEQELSRQAQEIERLRSEIAASGITQAAADERYLRRGRSYEIG